MSIDLIPPSGNSAAAGVGGISALLTSLTGAIGAQWDIDEGAYGHEFPVLFHVFKTAVDNFGAAVDSIQDNGGRRKVAVHFPYMDGQSTDDLGRMGDAFDVNILIFGPNYKTQYEELIREFNDPTPGKLRHPVRGIINAVAADWVVTHSSNQKQAVAMRVRFMEHTFSVDYSLASVPGSFQSALTSAVAFIGKISKAIADVQSIAFVASNTSALVTSLMNDYMQEFSDVLVRLNQTFNPGSSLSIPGLVPLVQGQTNSTNVSVAASIGDAFAGTASLVGSQSSESQSLTAALATEQAVDNVRNIRESLEAAIESINATQDGQGALIFFDQILVLKRSAQAMVDSLELGIQSSKNTVVSYTTPRDMSVREACFANGLSPDSSYDLEVLNPTLLSLNLIPKGTLIKVPK